MESKLDKKKILYFKVFLISAIVSLGVLLVISFVIPYSVNNWVIDSLGNNDSSLAGSWISFWGSFLGGIVGMVAVVLTTYALIRNQNNQHLELLFEQKNSIDEAAELNDKKTREREHKLFLLNKSEELVESITNMTKLIKLRNEIFRKIDNIGQEISNLTNQQEFLRDIHLVHSKEESVHEVILSLMMEIKSSQFRESELFAEIEIEISKVRILYSYLDYESDEVEIINDLLNKSSYNMIELINKKEFGESYQQKMVEFNRDLTKLLNEITKKHVENNKLLFENYKK
ncbi:DUF456 domain-containing protein [Lysinibacillus fusiformis]|uniref:DUF456 domain-containing protein n=1 Tax=Lysinibacillus TaxID=400634 RepID=UPI0000F390CE|nr:MULTISPECIES: DUF456 domain-containing protein [Lysinibacillus]EAZ84907.1 hypothetical protein BB14905_13940 [Bacillus sp. B14905]MED4077954.1 DUF456 domain-containing protein [Lysinibacillus fusiformis]